MQAIRSAVQRLLTPRGFVLLFFTQIAVSMGLFLFGTPHQLASSGFDLPDNRASYDTEELLTTWTAYGERGRALYRSFLLFADLPYALLTALVSVSALSIIRSSLPHLNLGVWIFLFPVALLGLDVLENALLLSMLRNFQNIDDYIAGIAGKLTAVKLALVNVTFLLYLFVWVLLIRNWWSARNSKNPHKEGGGDYDPKNKER